MQDFARPDDTHTLYVLVRFLPPVDPQIGNSLLVKGNIEGFSQLYPFVESASCEEQYSQLRLATIVAEFGKAYVLKPEGPRSAPTTWLIKEGKTGRTVATARPFEMEVEPAAGWEEGQAYAADRPTSRSSEHLQALRIEQQGVLRTGSLEYVLHEGAIYDAPYMRYRFQWRERSAPWAGGGAGRFLAINGGALAENLLESELFGHERGAFTGAVTQKKGKFEQANGGTLFLDEIGEISPAMQVKLLRVLQEREFQRVGGHEDIKVDVRIIAATNQDLQGLVVERKFRQDLFYRLNVFPLQIPPLRERVEDIPLIAQYLLDRHATAQKKAVKGLTGEALEVLVRYRWPGNVRELENVIERALALAGPKTTMIGPDLLPPSIREAPETISAQGFDDLVDRVE